MKPLKIGQRFCYNFKPCTKRSNVFKKAIFYRVVFVKLLRLIVIKNRYAYKRSYFTSDRVSTKLGDSSRVSSGLAI